MSLTIAFSTNLNKQEFQTVISEVCDKFNYTCSFTLKNAQAHVFGGIKSTLAYLSEEQIAFIHTSDRNVPEAPLIGMQLIEGGDKRNAILFFQNIGEKLLTKTTSFTVMFAVEDWSDRDPIRVVNGDLEEFIKLLNTPCAWCIELFKPKLKIWTCNDSYPLVYHVEKQI
ncbi:hypothetical protein [Leptospira haakeii]|uniref:Uncharacterized protein n=1 Tax=Leptospira haakeii TaxID=2023198 RepID=A0ABX4PMW3_9LEPT|nr:hypothetical protein [Leptospira haakeii]PKA15718.1 hypothetical protein CH363_11945 [Leptospira haakeii]PKA21804.1 hypothetical protein CH377_05545 [Leptospira haakeii]